MRKIDKLKNIQKANILAEQRYLKSKGLINETDNELSLLKEEICKLHENNINEGLFDKAKEFFKKTFQKGEYRYKAIDLLLKSIDRNELHNEIDLDKKFKEMFDIYTVNNQKLNDILYPHLGRTERLKKLNDGQFKIVMSRIKEVISMIESDSKYLKQLDSEEDERKKQEEKRKKQEEDRKKQDEERRNKQNKLYELWATISNTIYKINTITPFEFLFRYVEEGEGSGKHDNLDTTDDTLKMIYKLSNKNVNQEIDTSSIINELNLLNQNFENYVNLYKEVYGDDKSLQEKIKQKEEHNNYANQVLENIKKYKTYKEMVLDVLTKKKRLVYHKGKIVYHGSTRRDLEKDKFNNTINTEKRTGYGLYTSPQLTTACRYAFAHIFGDLQKRGVPIKPNLDGKASIYRIELGDMPFLLRFDPNIDKEELEMLLAFGIGGYDGLYKARSGNEVEISVITSDNISKAERITERNYPKEFKEITEYGLKYIKSSEYNNSSPTGFVQNQKFITARLEERLNSLLEERKQHNKINNQLIESILNSNNLNENENFDKLKDKLKQAAKAGILTTVIITKLLGTAYGLNPDQKSEIKDIAKKANIELSADDQITPDVNEPYKTIIKTLEKDGKIKSVNKPWGQFNDDTQFKTFSAVGQTEAAAKSAAMQTAIINGASTTDLQMSGQITIELPNGNIKVVYLIHKEKPQPKNLDDKQNLGDKIKSQTQKIGGDIKSTTSKVTGDIKNIFKK